MDAPARTRAAIAALVAVQVLFGAFPVAAKVVLREMGPLALAWVRVTVAAVFLLVLQRMVVGERLASRRELRRLALLAVLGVVANQILFIEGLHRTTAINAVVLIATIPVMTMLIAVTLGKEPLRRGKAAGIVLSLAGVLVLLRIEALELSSAFFVGNLMVFVNCLSYSAYLVFSKPFLERHHPLTLAAGAFLLGAIMMLPLSATGAGSVPWEALSGVAILALAFIIAGPSVGTYALNAFALSRLEASTVALYIYLQPIVTTALAVVYLGETITPRTVVAAGLIFAGVAVATGRRRPARTTAEVPVAETRTFR